MESEDEIKRYRKMTQELYEDIIAQRDKIITAFIAQRGCNPDEIRQVYSFDGKEVRWWLEKKNMELEDKEIQNKARKFWISMEKYWLSFFPKPNISRKMQGIKKFITTNCRKKNMG